MELTSHFTLNVTMNYSCKMEGTGVNSVAKMRYLNKIMKDKYCRLILSLKKFFSPCIIFTSFRLGKKGVLLPSGLGLLNTHLALIESKVVYAIFCSLFPKECNIEGLNLVYDNFRGKCSDDRHSLVTPILTFTSKT